jgi:Domain of unknown function (DUF4265)
MEESQAGSPVKVVVLLEQEEEDYPPVDYEELWTTPLGEGLYRIESIPFFARGIARGDIVSAVEEEEALIFQGVEEQSGHSTIRLVVYNADAVPAITERFERLGCLSETTFTKLVALDVPPSLSLESLRERLDLGFTQGQWDYEEASIFHPKEELPEEEASEEEKAGS